ncbi:MAG: tetratricopeptide repeat protein [Bacteroidetes bacterium]|nr:tetratricopeptide repeat protein [Bacteroidota bacterium]
MDDTKVREIADHLQTFYGLSFLGPRFFDLSNAIEQTAIKLKVKSHLLTENLLNNTLTKEEFNILLDNLQINETYFFREEKILDLLSHIVAASEKKTSYNIWSVGCSTGEEPYSILMHLNESPSNKISHEINLLATDINLHSIEKALDGKYTSWSFRNTTSKRQEKYFTKENGSFRIKQDLLKQVKFRIHNLQRDLYPELTNGTAMQDTILCRNVLIYFNKESRDRIISKLCNCLVPGGLLLLGLTESSFVKNDMLDRIIEKDIVYFRKRKRPIHKSESCLIRDTETITPLISKSIITSEKTEQEKTEGTTDNRWQKYYDQGNYQLCADEILKENRATVTKFNLGVPDDKIKFELLINSLVNLGKINQSIEYCMLIQETNRENPYFYLLLANLFVHSGDNESAIDNLTKAIYLDQDYISAHLLLGRIYFHQGEKELSNKHYSIALDVSHKFDDNEIIDNSNGFSAKIIRETILRYLEVNRTHGRDKINS